MIKGLKNVVDHKAFQGFILFVIVFNSVVMGIETISGLPDKVQLVLGLINNICLWIFIIEMLFKFLAATVVPAWQTPTKLTSAGAR